METENRTQKKFLDKLDDLLSKNLEANQVQKKRINIL